MNKQMLTQLMWTKLLKEEKERKNSKLSYFIPIKNYFHL